nr:hypothetical protein [Sicyoidochytrium minutum DNA virus]
MSDLVLKEVKGYLCAEEDDYEIISFDTKDKCRLVKVVKGKLNAYRETLMYAMSKQVYFGDRYGKPFPSWDKYINVVHIVCSADQLWRVQYPIGKDVRARRVNLMTERELEQNIRGMVSYSEMFHTDRFIVRPRKLQKYSRELLQKVVKNYCAAQKE